MKRTNGEKIFSVFNYALLSALLLATLYPCLYVAFMSVSDPSEMVGASGLVWRPIGLNFQNYISVFENKSIWTGYRNTIMYAVAGTSLSVLLTVVASFCLSRKNVPGTGFILLAITISMYFSGGMIPNYILVRKLGILDSFWAMILPKAISTYNFIITLTYFKNMPDSLSEAAEIDGANEFTVLFKILVPLAKPIIAVIALYYLVAVWNDYMSGLLYINSPDKYPLQLVIREILFQNAMRDEVASQVDTADLMAENIKYATMVVTTIPVLCIYPFLQKFFVKGIMIGAVKG